MATTNIELDIENITGVSDADDQYIKTAQKFVVSSIPKELMKWAGTTTAVGSHGGDSSPTAITLPQPTDNIIDVQRNGFSANEVPESMQGFIANSSSLHLATETYPKYYMQAGNKVIVKPDPSDSEPALVNYVDFLKVDDDCDLRGAVIFHAVAQEFEKIASGKVVDWSDLVAPTSPSLTSSSVSFSTGAPIYDKPSSPSQAAFNDYWTLSDFGDSDPGSFTISAVAPAPPASPSISAPSISAITISPLATAPVYIPPTMNTPDFSDANTWINTEEDPEMVASRVQVISAQVNEYSSRVQNALNEFNDANVEYQADLQHKIQQAQIDTQDAQKEGDLTFQATLQDYTQELSLFGAKVQEYQADVGKEVQQHTQNLSRYQLELNTVYTAWAKTESDNMAKYQSDMQNELNNFNKANAEYQAQLQISIQNAQLESQDDAQILQNYAQELQSYATKINEKSQKVTSGTQNAGYYSNEAKKYYEWALIEIKMYVENNSKMIGRTMAAQSAAQQQRR